MAEYIVAIDVTRARFPADAGPRRRAERGGGVFPFFSVCHRCFLPFFCLLLLFVLSLSLSLSCSRFGIMGFPRLFLCVVAFSLFLRMCAFPVFVHAPPFPPLLSVSPPFFFLLPRHLSSFPLPRGWGVGRGRAHGASATGTRARVARVRAEYPSQLDYSGVGKRRSPGLHATRPPLALPTKASVV